MKYPQSECCIEQVDCWPNQEECPDNGSSQKELMQKISELQFAAIDLNLFLDTHPDNQEALTLYKNVVNTLNSVKYDYESMYGPLTPGMSSGDAPFEWINDPWPWQI